MLIRRIISILILHPSFFQSNPDFYLPFPFFHDPISINFSFSKPHPLCFLPILFLRLIYFPIPFLYFLLSHTHFPKPFNHPNFSILIPLNLISLTSIPPFSISHPRIRRPFSHPHSYLHSPSSFLRPHPVTLLHSYSTFSHPHFPMPFFLPYSHLHAPIPHYHFLIISIFPSPIPIPIPPPPLPHPILPFHHFSNHVHLSPFSHSCSLSLSPIFIFPSPFSHTHYPNRIPHLDSSFPFGD